MSHYVRSRIGEYIACVCMSVGLCYALYAGFILTDVFSSSALWVFAAAAAVTALMYVFAYNRIMVWVGAGTGVLFAAAVIIYMNIKKPWDDESANSAFLFWVITVVVSVLIFLITRTKTGCIIGIIVSNLIFAGSYFLDYPVKLWQYILLVLGSCILFLLRVYMLSVLKANTGRVRIVKYLVQSLIVALAAFLAALGIFYAVIRPLNPPTEELRLLSVMRSMELFEIFGIAQEREMYSPDQSGKDPDREDDANEEGEDEKEEPEGDPEDQEAVNDPDEGSGLSGLADWLKSTHLLENAKTVIYDLTGPKLFMLIAIIALVIAEIFLLRIVFLQRWRRKVQELPLEDGVVNYYSFFMTRFKRIGYKKPENYTLNEYTDLMSHQLEPYTRDGSSFDTLTDIYSRVYYGGRKVNEEEWELYENYFDGFHKNIRRDIGTFKYVLKIFRL